MYTLTRFFWPGGFPGALINTHPKLNFFFLENVRVEMVLRRGYFSLSFRGGGPGGSPLSEWHDFFVNLAPLLGSKGWIGYKKEKVYSFDMCLEESEEKDNAFLMEKYLVLLRYCGIEPHQTLAPRIVRETYMGENENDPKKMPVTSVRNKNLNKGSKLDPFFIDTMLVLLYSYVLFFFHFFSQRRVPCE